MIKDSKHDTTKRHQVVNEDSKEEARDKGATVSPYPSIITLNTYGLNSPIQRHRMAEQIKKQDPTISCLQKTQLRFLALFCVVFCVVT